MIAIIDYGMGNVRSVYNALDYLGLDAVITADPKVINNASRLILPGVGAFGDAMRNLQSRALDEVLNQQVLQKGKPLLGICLGLQLMAKSSTEHGEHKGLGWFDAEVMRFDLREFQLKIPHMGWNKIEPEVQHPLLKNLKEDEFTFYFVHSYHVACREEGRVAASCWYGNSFTAAIYRDNIFATQFHPEKSQDNGIQILKNFANWNS
jgi:glutamine amidotransferase